MGGQGLLRKYDNSPSALLLNAYPEYNWLPWKFDVAPKRFWDSHQNQVKFMHWAGTELGYQKMEDWYKITVDVNFRIKIFLVTLPEINKVRRWFTLKKVWSVTILFGSSGLP